jgi:hypothetical protein
MALITVIAQNEIAQRFDEVALPLVVAVPSAALSVASMVASGSNGVSGLCESGATLQLTHHLATLPFLASNEKKAHSPRVTWKLWRCQKELILAHCQTHTRGLTRKIDVV